VTITGLLGSVIMAYIVYRGLVDPNYGANQPGSFITMMLVIVVGIIWYFVARAIRARQGINLDARFKEIPVE